MYELSADDLAAYPGVKVPSQATADLVVKLTDGKINGVRLNTGGQLIGEVNLSPVQKASVDAIALEVAGRALKNPTGATSVTTGIDDWKQTLRYEGEVALSRRAGVYLTDDEEADLRALFDTDEDTVSRPSSIRMRVPGVSYAHCI